MASSLRRPVLIGLAVAAAAALAGCQSVRLPWARPVPPPAPVAQGPRIVVVDLDRATRAHPRWPEVDALDRRIEGLVGQVSAVSAAVDVAPPSIDLTPQLRAAMEQETARLAPAFRRRMEAEASDVERVAKRELDAYAAKVRADQEAAFRSRQAELQAGAQKAVHDKAQALQEDSAQFQQQMLEQYRLPLLNLHLKLDAVQPTDRKEADRVSQQLQALTKERDDKIAAHEKANEDDLTAFQTQQQAAYTQQLQALQQELSKQGQQLVDQRAAEINARLHTDLSATEAQLAAEFNAQVSAEMRARQQAIVAGARAQVTAAQSQSAQAVEVRVASLRAQIEEAQAERARLLAAIMADLRVEIAEMAQAKGWDLVLTRAIQAPDAPDVTDDLIARIKK